MDGGVYGSIHFKISRQGGAVRLSNKDIGLGGLGSISTPGSCVVKIYEAREDYMKKHIIK